MSKLKVDEIRSADRSVSDSANITLADNGNTSLGGTLSAGTIGGNVVFPTGHIVQSQFSPSIVANTSNHTTEAVAASVSSQITITSGNGVLIYWQAGNIYMDRDSGDMGYYARIREGTSTSGDNLARAGERHTAHPSNWFTNISYF